VETWDGAASGERCPADDACKGSHAVASKLDIEVTPAYKFAVIGGREWDI